MNLRTHFHRLAWLSLPLLLQAPTVFAAADKAAVAAATQRYQQEKQVCLTGRSNQDRATCLREAEAALAEVKRGRAGDGAASYSRNAKARCEPLPADQRQDCEARMRGQGTTTGSAPAGGIYRELVTVEIQAPAAKASEPSMSAPSEQK